MTLIPFAATAQIGSSTGSNAGPLVCLANATGAPHLRSEGYTELLSDITITCTGGQEYGLGSNTPATNITVSVWPALPPAGGILSGAGNPSEALLFIDEPGSLLPTGAVGNFGPRAPQILCSQFASGCPTYVGADGSGNYRVASSVAPAGPGSAADGRAANIYRGLIGAPGSGTVTFYGVPVLPPVKAGVTRVFRIANLRVPTGGLVSVSSVQLALNQTLGVTPTHSVRAPGYEELYRYSLLQQSQTPRLSTSWYNPSWPYRKAITIPHGQISGTAVLIAFPVLVSVTDPNLKSFSQASGKDILFTAGDGITKLNHEIESYNAATGQLVAWVQMPSLSPAADTGFYMYYGNTGAGDQSNTAAVWSKYTGVWHLANGSALTVTDSTANANNAFSTSGSVAATGQIGGGASLAVGSIIRIPESSSLEFGTNSYSYSIWFKTSANAVGAAIFANQKARGWRLIYSTGGDHKLQARIYDGVIQVSTPESAPVSDGAWHYAVIAVDRSAAQLMHLFLDGAEVGAGTALNSLAGAITDPTAELDIDGFGGTPNGFIGQVDEARVVDNTEFSADWIKTEYNNQSAPAGFYALASQESYSASPVIGSFAANPASVSSGQPVTLSWATSGATSLSIDQNVGTVTGTSMNVSPALTTTYTLTATNGAGGSTAQATATVVNNSSPLISSFTASPSTITAGQATTLRWTVSGAPAPAISINNGIGAMTGTSVAVSPAVTTTYTLTASNSFGYIMGQTVVNVGASQTATPAISPNGGTFNSAQTVTLSDSTAGASIYYTVDGSAPTASSTLYKYPFTDSSSGTIRAIGVLSGAANSNSASAGFIINTGAAAPVINYFVPPPPGAGLAGHPTTLYWSVSGSPAPTISIDNGIGTVSGTSLSISPSGMTTYNMTATNSAGTATAQTSVYMTPVIVVAFAASPYVITPGQSTTLSWIYSADSQTTVSLDNGVGAVSGNSVSVSPAATTTYTITFSNSSGSITSQATVAVSPSTTSLLNQSYSSLAPARQYDLFYPSSSPNPQNNPIVVYIHGGGWTAGDKNNDIPITGFPGLIQKGYNVYDIDYTLANVASPATRWPAQMQDVKCFLSYLGSGHGVGDPNRISIWGFSAGAHLAVMAAITNKNQFSNDCEWNSAGYTIKSVAGSSTPTDLSVLTNWQAVPAVEDLLGYFGAINPAGALAASPVSYASAAAPAILLESGSSDGLIPASQSQELVNAFANIGVPVQRLLFNGFGHTLDLDQPNGQAIPPVIAFIVASFNR